MPLNSGDGRGRSPEGRKSRFVGEERRSPSLQRGEHVTVVEAAPRDTIWEVSVAKILRCMIPYGGAGVIFWASPW
jgi:hypothetical protein